MDIENNGGCKFSNSSCSNCSSASNTFITPRGIDLSEEFEHFFLISTVYTTSFPLRLREFRNIVTHYLFDYMFFKSSLAPVYNFARYI